MAKYKTKHRAFHFGKDAYMAHRDGSKVWVTTGKDKLVTVFQHCFEFVSQAKKWIDHPTLGV